LVSLLPNAANVRVPTLVLHCSKDALVPVENGRYLASQIPGAKYVEYADRAHGFLEGDVPKLFGEIEEFVTGKRESELPDLERSSNRAVYRYRRFDEAR
jgi:pimeloyl-ACP methyl ester carboxylesterase